MSVLKAKRTTSKAEFVNTANQLYVETLNFLTRLSARYSRLIAEDIAHLAGGVWIKLKWQIVSTPQMTRERHCARRTCWRQGLL